MLLLLLTSCFQSGYTSPEVVLEDDQGFVEAAKNYLREIALPRAFSESDADIMRLALQGRPTGGLSGVPAI
jgi:hypothetical protein